MASYKEMFGMTHGEIVKRGAGGERFDPRHVEYVVEDEEPVLLLYFGESSEEDVERVWPAFQQGLRVAAVVEFSIDCPRCDGDGCGPQDACSACDQDQTCSQCDGYGYVGLRKVVGQPGSQLGGGLRTGRWD